MWYLLSNWCLLLRVKNSVSTTKFLSLQSYDHDFRVASDRTTWSSDRCFVYVEVWPMCPRRSMLLKYANMFIHTRTCLQRSRFGSCVKLFHQVWAVCCLRTWFTTNIRVRSLEFNVSNRSHVKLMRHLYMDVRLVKIVHKWLLRLGITSVELSLQLALLSVIRWRVVGLLTI